MNQQKGFSLIEVLLSLFLMSTVAMAVLQQQRQSRQLISQLILSAGASHYLDQVDERLVIKSHTLPAAPPPYELSIQQSGKDFILHLGWLQNLGSITRGLNQAVGLK